MIGRFLSKHWLELVLCLGALFLFMRIETLKASNAALTATVAARDATIEGLGGQLTRQNAGIRALADAAAANREVYLAGLDAANRQAIRLEIDAEDILSLPVPPEPQQCEAARELLIGD